MQRGSRPRMLGMQGKPELGLIFPQSENVSQTVAFCFPRSASGADIRESSRGFEAVEDITWGMVVVWVLLVGSKDSAESRSWDFP